ncbi:MAG: hypothetical protein ABL953_00440 [Ilumatobacteraceae bacterium]
MLTGFDDYPLHQTSMPIAHTATSDLNHYDRYFFNGYSRDGSLFFAVAMGLYPNRHVADAAFSVVRGNRQHSVFHSQRAPLDRRDCTALGPIVIEVLEPLQTLRVLVNAPEHGLRAELTFDGRSAALEEPPFFLRAGTRTFLDFTRLTQFGSWSGWLEVDGERHEISPADVWGCRDRSWGIRPVGERGATGAPVMDPQYFWLWAPVNFPSLSTHFDVNEYSDGRRWHEAGALVPVAGSANHMRTVDWRIGWRPGTRWADWFEYDLIEHDGSRHTVRLTPRYEFLMRGIGYGHPEFAHGTWKGEALTAGECIDLPVATPLSREHVHVQALCDATLTMADGTQEQGIGILEQLCFGDHPSGLRGVLDGYSVVAQ